MSIIAFQGQPGAYSDLACRIAYPGAATLPCETFQAAMAAVREGRADLAMLPPENSLAGRVADMHALLPESGLSIIGETFLRVEHCLLAPRGTKISDIKRVHSHTVALGQVRGLLAELGATPVVEYDTAGAAQIVAKLNNKEDAAIASSLAGEMHGLDILRHNVEDADHNTTRFYVMAREPLVLEPETPGLMTTFVFNVR
ncbi:MAG: prephenate dehydratase, partial [Rhodospirillales bacterium]|nr:prephenate dehydratase [Rhodospirillales bacterium]